MRLRTCVSALVLLLALAAGLYRAEQPPEPPPVPTAKELVAYLNDQASRVRALLCLDVQLDLKQGPVSWGMNGHLAFHQGRNLRLCCRALGQPVLDLGANGREMWFWFGKAVPPLAGLVRRADLPCSKAVWLAPVPPDWLAEVLGVCPRSPTGEYQVVAKPDVVELVEPGRTPRGDPVRRVTVFRRKQGAPQVVGHRVEEEKGRVLLRAEIARTARDPGTGVNLPVRLRLLWPAEKLEISARLCDPVVNPDIPADRLSRLYGPPEQLKGK
jgi:hypothetical protein